MVEFRLNMIDLQFLLSKKVDLRVVIAIRPDTENLILEDLDDSDDEDGDGTIVTPHCLHSIYCN